MHHRGLLVDAASFCTSAAVAAAVCPVHPTGQSVCNLRSLGQTSQGRVPSGGFISAESAVVCLLRVINHLGKMYSIAIDAAAANPCELILLQM